MGNCIDCAYYYTMKHYCLRGDIMISAFNTCSEFIDREKALKKYNIKKENVILLQ